MNEVKSNRAWRLECEQLRAECALLRGKIRLLDGAIKTGAEEFVQMKQQAEAAERQLKIEMAACDKQLTVEKEKLKAVERRLAAMMPLFQEARDALPAISLASAKLHGLDLTLADRMDDVGIKARWEAREATQNSPSAPASNTQSQN